MYLLIISRRCTGLLLERGIDGMVVIVVELAPLALWFLSASHAATSSLDFGRIIKHYLGRSDLGCPCCLQRCNFFPVSLWSLLTGRNYQTLALLHSHALQKPAHTDTHKPSDIHGSIIINPPALWSVLLMLHSEDILEAQPLAWQAYTQNHSTNGWGWNLLISKKWMKKTTAPPSPFHPTCSFLSFSSRKKEGKSSQINSGEKQKLQQTILVSSIPYSNSRVFLTPVLALSRGKRQHKSVKNCTHIHTRAREMTREREPPQSHETPRLQTAIVRLRQHFLSLSLVFSDSTNGLKGGAKEKNTKQNTRKASLPIKEWVSELRSHLRGRRRSTSPPRKGKKKSLRRRRRDMEKKKENPKLAVARCSLDCSHCLHFYHKTHKTKRLFSNKVYFSSLRAFSSLPESSLFCPSVFLCVAVFVGVFSFPAAAAAAMSTRLNLGMMTR